LATALTAAPTEPVKLGALGLSGLGIPADKLQYYSDHLAQQLSVSGVRVITQAELAALIGLERQKELLGCANDSGTCTAEITAALGVDGIVTGSLGFHGDEFQLDIKVVATGDKPPLSVYSQRGATRSLLDEIDLAAWQVAIDVLHVLRPGTPPPPKPAPVVRGASALRHLAWIPVTASFLVALVSAPFFSAAKSDHDLLTYTPALNFYTTTPQQYAQMGNSAQTTAGLLVAGAGLLMAVGLFIFTWFSLR
jgi:hypothetical protein